MASRRISPPRTFLPVRHRRRRVFQNSLLLLHIWHALGTFAGRRSRNGKCAAGLSGDRRPDGRCQDVATHRIIIVDDHPLFRGALRQALDPLFDMQNISEAGSLDELSTALAANGAADLILLDLAMPGVQGLSGLLFLRASHPEIPVIVVSASDEPSIIHSAMQFGASGYVPKSQPVERIREAVSKVLQGELWVPDGFEAQNGSHDDMADLAARLSTLTPQQVRVLMMLGEGLLNKQIAFKLSVSEATVKAHVSAILQKLGVDSRTQAVIAVNKIDAALKSKPSG
ncbi:MAG: response regulator transcription factor [Hyphomicrobiaceae bacterium]|nr:response regulator transcription factor [Hyphomicrobiaceae bacterium]